jgi:hypothetical protein
MAATTMTNLTTANRTMWETGVLAVADGMLVADKFAKTKVIGIRAGGTYVVNRLLKVAPVTTAATYGTVVAGSAAKNLVSNKVEINPELWQDSFGFDDDVDIKAFFTDEDYKKTIGQQMANSLDKELIRTLGVQGLRHRIDKDATYQKTFTVTSATSTLITSATDFTEATNFWDGGFITVTNADGAAYDETQKVTTYTLVGGVGDTFLTPAWTNTLGASSKARVTVGTGVVATDKLTSAGLLDVAALHRKLETEKFPGGVLHGFIDAAQEADLWTDTGFIANAAYDASQRFANYRLVRWLDMELLVSSNIYRETVAGAASDTGVVYVSPIFGANAYCLIKWGTPGAGNYGVKFNYVFEPDSQNLNLNERYISWKTSIGKKVLRSTSVIGLMTGATDLAILY